MALGLLTANIADARDIQAALIRRGVSPVLLGTQKSEFTREWLDGSFAAIDLRALGEGRLSAKRLLPRLLERGIDRVINGGTLTGLLDSTIHLRLGRRASHLDVPIERQKTSAIRLAEILQAGGVRVEWLAHNVPDVSAGLGVLNDVDLQVPLHLRRDALRTARLAASEARVACAWVGDGSDQGERTFDTDEKLKALAGRPPPRLQRMLVKVVGSPDHCPLDPPLIGPPTIAWAKEAHVKTILIDHALGVIVSRDKTLARAAEANIAIVGV